jgi:hypothetical protein
LLVFEVSFDFFEEFLWVLHRGSESVAERLHTQIEVAVLKKLIPSMKNRESGYYSVLYLLFHLGFLLVFPGNRYCDHEGAENAHEVLLGADSPEKFDAKS